MQMNGIHPMIITAKRTGVSLIASDIDWTLRDPTDPVYNFQAVQKLCLTVLQKKVTILLITGRDASLRKDFVPDMITLLRKHHVETSMYTGCANGISLYEICNKCIRTIYEHPLLESNIDQIVKIIKETQVSYELTPRDFQQRGISTFQSFLLSDWKTIIPKKYIQKAKPLNGSIFIEPSQLSFVLPKSRLACASFINKIKKSLPNIFCVQSDLEFGHISLSKSPTGQRIADKSSTLEYVRKKLRIGSRHLTVFGGALDQIDRKMLHQYPFSFTNQQKYRPAIHRDPPYKLTGKQSPVGLVYEAIQYIVS
jgi:hydroxymethylpyrimidine pyrophosphatase-like HAD family hydrolase